MHLSKTITTYATPRLATIEAATPNHNFCIASLKLDFARIVYMIPTIKEASKHSPLKNYYGRSSTNILMRMILLTTLNPKLNTKKCIQKKNGIPRGFEPLLPG